MIKDLATQAIKEMEDLDTAIKSLKQPDSDACVNRQATLDAIIKELCIKDESYLLQSEKVIYNVVKNMPPATPTQRWIPVSEGLPEEHEWIGTKQFKTTISDNVYVTFETPDGARFTDYIRLQNGKPSLSKQCELDAISKDIKLTAWMPLPKPYEGGTKC